jgi:hypothetical protein
LLLLITVVAVSLVKAASVKLIVRLLTSSEFA